MKSSKKTQEQVNILYNDIIQILDQHPVEKISKNRNLSYYNANISFDIETTSFRNSTGEKLACMYIWAMGLFGEVITGRTWQEFLEVLEIIQNYYNTNESSRVIIYVHNLAFDSQFFIRYLNIESVMALDSHKPVKILTKQGIEFRCSYINTNLGLEALANNLTSHTIEKLKGDLDYSLIRHYKTPLTEKEMGYIENDVKIINYYIEEQLDIYNSIGDIPLTATGYVREYVRNKCFGITEKKWYKKKNYYNFMRSIPIGSVREYDMLKQAFQGGFTHANAYHSGAIIENVSSYDFTSSYPAVMASEQFPMSAAEEIKITSKEQLLDNLKKYCCLFDIEYKNIKENHPEHPISVSRCWKRDGVEEDNGRLVSADLIRMTITEQDYYIIDRFYKYEGFRIGKFYRYKKGFLPRDIIEAIYELYEKKTTLKGIKEKKAEYNAAKALINALYGMCVTDIIRDDYIYDDGEWEKVEISDITEKQERLEKYNKNYNRFLCYQWGVWITAYARRNLFSAIYTIKDDYIYSDTDSVKIMNAEKYEDYFNKYNECITKKLFRVCDAYNIDREKTRPKTKNGKVKPLGVWDYEGTYDYFKTLGAKRYLYYIDGEIHLTCAGVSKTAGADFLKEGAGSIEEVFDHFSDGLEIPGDKTGKNTHTYIDDPFTATLTDYRGETVEIYETGAVNLEPAKYNLSLSEKYFRYLLKLAGGSSY